MTGLIKCVNICKTDSDSYMSEKKTKQLNALTKIIVFPILRNNE